MEYKVYKDKADNYVLVINTVLVMLSNDLSEITAEIHRDAEIRKTSTRRLYDEVIISTNNKEEIKSPDVVKETESIPKARSLSDLLGL